MAAHRTPRQPRLCYACGAPATTREHVPPDGFFPPRTDMADGSDCRVNLITVPSCDRHNGDTSSDDEHTIDAIQMVGSHTSTGEAAAQRMLRCAARHPGKYRRRVAGARPVLVVDGNNIAPRQAVPIEWDRVVRTIRKIARGLYFYVTRRAGHPERLTEDLRVLTPDFADLAKRTTEANLYYAVTRSGDWRPHPGPGTSQPHIFHYDIARNVGPLDLVIHLAFYECVRFLVFPYQAPRTERRARRP